MRYFFQDQGRRKL